MYKLDPHGCVKLSQLAIYCRVQQLYSAQFFRALTKEDWDRTLICITKLLDSTCVVISPSVVLSVLRKQDDQKFNSIGLRIL